MHELFYMEMLSHDMKQIYYTVVVPVFTNDCFVILSVSCMFRITRPYHWILQVSEAAHKAIVPVKFGGINLVSTSKSGNQFIIMKCTSHRMEWNV